MTDQICIFLSLLIILCATFAAGLAVRTKGSTCAACIFVSAALYGLGWFCLLNTLLFSRLFS